VLDQRALDAILAGVRRDDFTSVFAIDHAELRAGGIALLEGKGDLAKALFESRSSAQLTALLNRLRDEHGKLYVARGKNPVLNTALGADGSLNRARRELGASVLRPEAYRDATLAVDEARKQLAAITEQLNRARAEQSRLSRIKQAGAGMEQRARLLDERAQLLDAGPLAPGDAGPDYERIRAARQEAQVGSRRGAVELADTQTRLLKQKPDYHALEQAAAITELHAEANGVGKVEKQGTKAEQSAAELRAQAAARLAKARPGHGGESEIEAVAPGLRKQVDELRETQLTLDAESRGARKHAANRDKALARELKKLAAIAEPADHTALRAAIKAVPPALPDLITNKAKQSAAAEAKQRKLRARHARFALPDDAADLTLPGTDEIAAHRKRQDTADKTLARCEERRDGLAKELGKQRRALEAFLRDDPPPSEADLDSARALRQDLWGVLRSRITDPRPPAPEAAQSPLPVSDYERSVAASDETADRIRREARRLAELRSLEAGAQHAEQELAEAREQHDAASRDRQELTRRWDELWASSGLPAPAPEAAADLVGAVAAIRTLTDERDELRLELESDRAAAEQHAARLREMLADTAAPPPGATASLAELLETATEHHSMLADAAKKRASAAARSEELRAELSAAAEEVAELDGALEAWGQQWARLLDAHQLSGTPAEVTATLAELEAIGRLYEEAARADKQEAQAREQVESFTARLAEVLEAARRTKLTDPGRRYAEIKTLKQYLETQQKEEAERLRLSEHLDLLRAEQEKTLKDEAEHDADMGALLARCAVVDEAELAAAIERTRQVRELDKRLEAVVHALSGSGVSVAQLEQEVADSDPDLLGAAIAEYNTGIEQLDDQRGDKAAEVVRLELAMERMNGSDAAALAADEVEQELARISRNAQDYLRLRLAEQILLANIEAYRKENQAPVLRRAQQVFATLTRGRFPELVDDTEVDGRAVLRARRSSGAFVNVEEMSEGTRDQLYLALRLASLDHYADEGRAMPLLLDDVLMTFDNGRTGAGFELLDAMADRFQIIVFTHHEHIGGIARAALPSGRVHVHDISPAGDAA
jgi:uncharacterized protein YhaN